ncbi:hypothetical protein BN1723_021052, partial [Verticillium longisporum]
MGIKMAQWEAEMANGEMDAARF